MCSAAETTFDSGAFATTMPRRVAASTSTLSTPTPARPITFRLRRRAISVGRHLRRRADDQRVVVADDLLERRVGVDVDVELRAQQLDAGIRDRLADENLHHAATGVSNASNARGDGRRRARCPRRARSATARPRRARVAMSKTSNQPMWPMRKIFPFRCAWPGRERDAVPVAQVARAARRRRCPSGARIGGHDGSACRRRARTARAPSP